MNISHASLDGSALGTRWWMLVVRGIASVSFGVLALAWPGISALALVLLWAAYALVDGVTAVAFAVRAGEQGRRWGWLLFEGLVSIGAAVVTAMWPGITAFALLMLIAAWAVLTGIAEIVAAIELRHVIRGEWMLAVCGVLSIVFGVVTAILPGPSAMALVTILGAYAVVFGVLVAALGFRVHHWAAREKRALVGATPAHA
ncbi:MAG: HdeD family acid-resistance protein [Gemmatimonadales bacterium]